MEVVTVSQKTGSCKEEKNECDVTRDQDAASIVTAIISLPRVLNLKTIAEGVETGEQRNILHLLRCDMGQGYYFSPPIPAEEFDNFLAQERKPFSK